MQQRPQFERYASLNNDSRVIVQEGVQLNFIGIVKYLHEQIHIRSNTVPRDV